MKLKAYLAENDMKLGEFAKSIDCNYSYLSNICKGSVLPGKRLAKAIEEATGGIVKFQLRKKESPASKSEKKFSTGSEEQISSQSGDN